MNEAQRNIAAAALVIAAAIGAVLLWPSGPVALDDNWLTDPVCAPVEGGVQFAATVQPSNSPENQLLRAELRTIEITVEAHEGGRRVASAGAMVPIRAVGTGQPLQLSSGAMATVDLVVPTGAIKSPTCSATILGHR